MNRLRNENIADSVIRFKVIVNVLLLFGVVINTFIDFIILIGGHPYHRFLTITTNVRGHGYTACAMNLLISSRVMK